MARIERMGVKFSHPNQNAFFSLDATFYPLFSSRNSFRDNPREKWRKLIGPGNRRALTSIFGSKKFELFGKGVFERSREIFLLGDYLDDSFYLLDFILGRCFQWEFLRKFGKNWECRFLIDKIFQIIFSKILFFTSKIPIYEIINFYFAT